MPMPELLIGPLLRYVSETEATIWVETSERCEVEVLGRKEPTFRFEDHHYALVRIEGLEPGTSYPYEVALDGQKVWPSSAAVITRAGSRSSRERAAARVAATELMRISRWRISTASGSANRIQ